MPQSVTASGRKCSSSAATASSSAASTAGSALSASGPAAPAPSASGTGKRSRGIAKTAARATGAPPASPTTNVAGSPAFTTPGPSMCRRLAVTEVLAWSGRKLRLSATTT